MMFPMEWTENLFDAIYLKGLSCDLLPPLPPVHPVDTFVTDVFGIDGSCAVTLRGAVNECFY